MTVVGGRAPPGCIESTVPGGRAEVGTHARRGSTPSRRRSAVTNPTRRPVSVAPLTRTIGGADRRGLAVLCGRAEPARPACHPPSPAIVSEAATASPAPIFFQAGRGCRATGRPSRASWLAWVAWAPVSANVRNGAADGPPDATAGRIAPDREVFPVRTCPACSATSRADRGRCPGFLAVSAATSALTSAGTVMGRAGIENRTWASATSSAEPWNGGAPVRHSYPTTPREYRSDAGVADPPAARSGAR